MQILFETESVSFDLVDTDLAPIYQQMIKHLRHIDIPFRPWDNPYNTDIDSVTNLIEYGKKVGVTVDRTLCNQEYFNMLHKIYEKNYNGDPAWLDYHEHIHICERGNKNQSNRYLYIDYREKAGLFEKPFDRSWLKKSTRLIKAGDVFVKWAELGKTPYDYWKDKEPNDINRIKELCKPWIKLRPKILVAIDDYDYTKVSPEFDLWWAQYHDEWCQHWNIPKWNLDDMMSVLVFGKVNDGMLEKLEKLILSRSVPLRVLL